MSENDVPANVVGLYSFPKSGNTWLRAIMAGIMGMPVGGSTLQKYVTDTHYGKVMENPWHFQGADWYLYKSHFRTPLTEDGEDPLVTDKFIHVTRHPLDVFMSYVNFASNNVAPNSASSFPFRYDSVEDLTDEQLAFLLNIFEEHGTLVPQNQSFGGVFEHHQSFKALKEQGKPILMLRYEDLHDDFFGEVGKICDFLGIDDVDPAYVRRNSERRTRPNGKFFWKRQKQNYQNFLSEEQIANFNDRWRTEMTLMGYAPEA